MTGRARSDQPQLQVRSFGFVLTLNIVLLHILENLYMRRYLFPRANFARIPTNVVGNELVPSTRLSIDHNLFPTELWDYLKSCQN